jgi:hypothetical protein
MSQENKRDFFWSTLVTAKYKLSNVITGLWISSIMYNNRRDGIAMNTRMTAGAIVHMVSIITLLE